MSQKAYMILDLQFGSTGKGLLAGYLAKTRQPDVLVTAWGPNAGHTYIDESGRKWVHTMLANGIVSPKLKAICIGPGSSIDIGALVEEVVASRDLLEGKDIIIHPQATIVSHEHRTAEALGANVKIGSTMKGTGAAMVQKIQRDPAQNPTARSTQNKPTIAFLRAALRDNAKVNAYVSAEAYHNAIDHANLLQIEGAQGFSLSMYHGFYPYTTSRDVTPAQVMADCAIPGYIKPEVYGTLRTFPIRVANRYDANGNMIGTSGPCYPDQREIAWSDIGVDPELTTVTKLPRRIFTFSYLQLREAIRMCAPGKLFLNFANYCDPNAILENIDLINDMGKEIMPGGRPYPMVDFLGIGPTHHDVKSSTWYRTHAEELIEKYNKDKGDDS